MPVDRRTSRQQPPPTGLRLAINEFADSTSMHGVPHIINARSLAVRVIWTIIVTGAFIMFFWQCGILLQRFYEYPKKVIVEIVQKPLPFPAVSICNSDHLDLEVAEHIERQFNRGPAEHHAKARHSNESRERQIMDFVRDYQHFQEYSVYFLALNNMREGLGSPTANIDYLSRIGLTANLGHAQSTNAGIRLQDFIIACRFMRNVDCKQLDVFKPFFDAYYFNCFTFDASSLFKSSTTRMFGLENGLTLMLFVDSAGHVRVDGIEGELMLPGTQESDLTLASGRGVRVIVHTPGTMAHPMVEGFDIPPGYSVTLAVKGRENERMSLPHGNCSEQLQGLSSGINYTLVDCQNMCIQRRIMDKCGCVDSRLGTPADVSFTRGLPFCNQLPLDLHKLTPSGEPCDYRDVINSVLNCQLIDEKVFPLVWAWRNMTQCYQDVYNNYTTGDPALIEACRCYPPCHDFVYDVSYSLSIMPEHTGEHAEFYSKINGFLLNLPPEKKAIMRANYGHNYSQHPTTHASRLTVYIADSNILKTTEEEDYEQTRLLSDIGGQLGLWIGISAITLFEVLMMGVNIFRYCTSGAGEERGQGADGGGGWSSGDDGHTSPARIPLRSSGNADSAAAAANAGAFPNHSAAQTTSRHGDADTFDARYPSVHTKDHTEDRGLKAKATTPVDVL